MSVEAGTGVDDLVKTLRQKFRARKKQRQESKNPKWTNYHNRELDMLWKQMDLLQKEMNDLRRLTGYQSERAIVAREEHLAAQERLNRMHANLLSRATTEDGGKETPKDTGSTCEPTCGTTGGKNE